jgi:rhodanese-related sulfurtransferase/DNA-binding transcriptional ArsR family regulator
MDPSRFKSGVYEHFARVAGALASPARLELLDVLASGEVDVEGAARRARLPLKNASAHLRVLRQARLVETRREGTRVFYRLGSPSVLALLRDLQGVGRERIADVENLVRGFLASRDPLEPLTRRELARRLREGTVTLIDVRPPEEYAAGHIPGAVSMPVPELRRRLREIPRRRHVVAYCRGPYCVYAAEAVEALRRRGFEARRLEDGFADWKARGLPVAASAGATRLRRGSRRRTPRREPLAEEARQP